MDRVADMRLSVEEPAPAHEPLQVIRQRVSDLARDFRETYVDEVHAALKAARREPRLAALIHELLEQHHVQYVRSSSGRTLRFILVDTLLELGFPHALEVRPEDLAYHRVEQPCSGSAGSLAAGFTVAAAVLSLLWTAVLAVGFLGAVPAWVYLLLLLVGLHALTALIFATRAAGAEASAAAGGLKVLAWEGLLVAPCIWYAEHALGNGVGVVALFLAAPFMLTALCSALTAARVR